MSAAPRKMSAHRAKCWPTAQNVSRTTQNVGRTTQNVGRTAQNVGRTAQNVGRTRVMSAATRLMFVKDQKGGLMCPHPREVIMITFLKIFFNPS